MLELRPSCKHCNAALPPDAPDARICSYERTFCAHCVEILRRTCARVGTGGKHGHLSVCEDLE